MDVLDVREHRIVVDRRFGPLEKMAGIESQPQAGDGLAQFHSDLRVGREGVDVREQGQHETFAHRVANQRSKPLDLVGDWRALTARRGA